MLTTKAYLLTWAFHTLAAAGLLAVVFRITHRWRPVALRIVLRTLAAVWLFMPAVVEPGAPREWLAPGLFVLVFEWMDSYEAAARVLEPMIVLSIASIPVALGAHWAWVRWQGGRFARQAARKQA